MRKPRRASSEDRPRRPAAAVERLDRGLGRWLAPLVVAVAALGVAVPVPGRQMAAVDGIPVTLVVLVASTGVSIAVGQIRQARSGARRAIGLLAVTSAALPVLAWATSRLVDPGPLQDGVLAVGVAPAEVASVAVAGLGGGEAALAAALLVGSTLVTVLAAGPILAALGAAATVSPTGLVTQLAFVVALPLALGILVRALLRPSARVLAAASILGTLALLVLLWQVASQITVQPAYGPITLALLGFLAGSAALGWLLTMRVPRPRRLALVLPVAMRDFAVAAGIASSAFGPAAAAPLGIYGVVVLLAGALAAHTARRAE